MGKSDGSVVIRVNMDVKQADKELAKLKSNIEKTEKEIEDTSKKRAEAQQKSLFQAGALDQEKAKLQEIKDRLADIRAMSNDKTISLDTREDLKAQIPIGQQELADQRTRVSMLQAEWNKTENAVESYSQKIRDANAKLEQQKIKAGELTQQIAGTRGAAEETGDALKCVTKRIDKICTRISRLASRVLFFSVITMALRSMRAWLGKVIKANYEASASIARLKGALLTLAQPLVNFIIPAFTTAVNILSDAITAIARIVTAAFGTTFEAVKDSAYALYEEQNAIGGVGNAAKRAEKNLATFDEINRLIGDSASVSKDTIYPDFSALDISRLPEWMKNLVFDLEAKIREIRFSYDNGEMLKNKDAWIAALTGILGLVIGGMFGGLSGAVIGLLLGTSIGLISCTFLDDLENPERAKELFLSALGAILGAILGSTFGGLAGGVIGLLLGALISFVAIEFSEGKFNKDEAITSLRIALFAILGLILGAKFGGLAGGVVGLILGLTIGFASVAFDGELSSDIRAKAEKALFVCMSTIIGMLIGSVFGGGVFGGIIGGTIGLTFGLAFTFFTDSFDIVKKNVPNFTGIGPDYSWMFKKTANVGISTKSIPGLATGAVIPPNREFMAVLGDQKSGTNIEAPESLIRKIVREEAGGGDNTALLQAILEAIKAGKIMMVDKKVLARAAAEGINDMTIAAGKSVLLL